MSSPEARGAGQPFKYKGFSHWFHGLMTAEAAERRLKLHGCHDGASIYAGIITYLAPGLFLVRQRTNSSDLMLMVCSSGQV